MDLLKLLYGFRSIRKHSFFYGTSQGFCAITNQISIRFLNIPNMCDVSYGTSHHPAIFLSGFFACSTTSPFLLWPLSRTKNRILHTKQHPYPIRDVWQRSGSLFASIFQELPSAISHSGSPSLRASNTLSVFSRSSRSICACAKLRFPPDVDNFRQNC